MKIFNGTFLLRLAVAIILLMHSIPGMFNNGIRDFGNLYLNEVGFAPFGLYLAWAIKLSHVVCAACFLLNRYIKAAAILTIFILVMGIIMVHYPEGWFVVGGGRNGVEFNFLLIAVLASFLFPGEWRKKQ
ncbi:MAG TPA: DoxX family protein [Ferruginibacter sp.]|nr:DoxX family protein [Ferruginibacter sp.]